MNQHFYCDARNLTARLMDAGLTATQAAKAAGLSPDTLYNLIRCDKKISLKVAGKLRNCFGDDVIKHVTPQQSFIDDRQRELDNLLEMRAELVRNYPADSKHLRTLDSMIDRVRADLETEVK